VRPAALELVGVTASSGDRPISAIDLVVGEGDAVAILGLPGAGKTSLMRLIAGLDDVARGTFRLFGHDLATLGFKAARALRDRVAVVFERGGIWANRTVAENLVLPVAYRRDERVAVLAEDPELHELLAAVGLAGIVDRATPSLDDSERRRVLFVRALYAKPDLLLVDEPQAALSRAHARLVAAEIERSRRLRAMTVVYGDADGRLEPFEADRPVVLQDRRIVPGAVRLPERGAAQAPESVGGRMLGSAPLSSRGDA
jgi:predicted ABC-type transport system involved in lysophospholipase L1 biosynthesis ATPase subunit